MFVLDAHALLAYLQRERGFPVVRDALAHAATHEQPLLMTVVNWGEVYYTVRRERGQKIADEVCTIIQGFPVELIAVDQALAKQAALFKSDYRMSYADCFAGALAHLRDATVLTGDPEFRSIEKEISIQWIR